MARAAPRTTEQSAWLGWEVDDRTGRRVGTVARVYTDPVTGAATWLLVRLDRYSTRFVVAPPADVTGWRGRLWLPYDRALIERAPVHYAPPRAIGAGAEQELRRHYRLAAAGGPAAVRITARRQLA